MMIESLFLPNSFGLHFLLMRDLQHLNDTGRRLLSAAAVPQEDSGYTSAAASQLLSRQIRPQMNEFARVNIHLGVY